MAEDVTQETLLRGLRHRRGLQDPLAWLRLVTVRRAMSHLRREGRREIGITDLSDSDPSESLAVRQTLSRLTLEQQAILALTVGEGWSYAEVAEALRIPVGTVASRLNAAKEAFRKKWQP